MKLSSSPPLSKWPFILGDLIIIGVASLLAVFAPKPYDAITASSIILCGILGILVFFLPFVIEYISQLWVAKNSYEDTIEKQFDSLVKAVGEIDQVARVLSGLAKNFDLSAERMRNLDAQFEERLSQIESRAEAAAEALDEKIDHFLERLDGSQNKEVKNLVAELSQMIEKHRDLLDRKEEEPDIEAEMISDLALGADEEIAPSERDLSSKPVGETDPVEDEDSTVESDPEQEFEEKEILQFETEPETRAPFRTPAANPSSLSLVAVVNVGIGNTPYVRGDGPGLSWTEGVPMKFLEIGKWEWSIENADEPAVIQIFKNDEISAFGEEVCVGLGERVEVHPKFPT